MNLQVRVNSHWIKVLTRFTTLNSLCIHFIKEDLEKVKLIMNDEQSVILRQKGTHFGTRIAYLIDIIERKLCKLQLNIKNSGTRSLCGFPSFFNWSERLDLN